MMMTMKLNLSIVDNKFWFSSSSIFSFVEEMSTHNSKTKKTKESKESPQLLFMDDCLSKLNENDFNQLNIVTGDAIHSGRHSIQKSIFIKQYPLYQCRLCNQTTTRQCMSCLKAFYCSPECEQADHQEHYTRDCCLPKLAKKLYHSQSNTAMGTSNIQVPDPISKSLIAPLD